MKKFIYQVISFGFLISNLIACKNNLNKPDLSAVSPTTITEQTPNDTDDPAIWIHPTDPSKSMVLGTDKNIKGGLCL